MNILNKTLLGGVALAALATAPSVAGNTHRLHVQALHAGRIVNKTKVHNYFRDHKTYTFGVSTSVPASDLKVPVKLVKTYYTWQCCTASCGNIVPPKQKIKAAKKTKYAEIGTARESYSLGCQYDPIVFYGDTYTLKHKSGFGQTDHFTSTLSAKYSNSGRKYKGTLNLDISVAIGTN